MSASRPLVSVLMATYNGASYVAETIESVLAQTYAPIELIAVDDASSDGTADLVEEYARREPKRVRLVRKNDRAGPCRRRNDALEVARGSVIAWLDQDDLWLPEKIELQVDVLEHEPEVGLVYTGYEAFDSDTGEVLPWRDESIEAEGDVLIPLFVEGCFIASLTAVFRREVMLRRKLRLRDSDFSFGDDYFLWLVISLDWKVARIEDVLARYRRHSTNESARLGESNFHLRRIALLREFLAGFPEAKSSLGRWRRRGLANHYTMAAFFELRPARLRPTRAAAWLGRALALAPAYTIRRALELASAYTIRRLLALR